MQAWAKDHCRMAPVKNWRSAASRYFRGGQKTIEMFLRVCGRSLAQRAAGIRRRPIAAAVVSRKRGYNLEDGNITQPARTGTAVGETRWNMAGNNGAPGGGSLPWANRPTFVGGQARRGDGGRRPGRTRTACTDNSRGELHTLAFADTTPAKFPPPRPAERKLPG